ncbi:putative ATP synthase subunit [Nymphaea thermarum]|nr:putative ATP synthase subunit [Nymphaea thermarum]
MAYTSRLLNRARLASSSCAGQRMLQHESVIPVRHFSKQADRPILKGDEMLKGIFFEVKKKFETALGVLRKEKITIDPDDPSAVEQYAKVMKTVREKADLFSESQRINYTIQTRTQGIPDARTYLLTLKEIRVKRGLTDDLGAETMMMEALDKVEKETKKPLLRSDKKGMALLLAEFDKINQKLGIRKENLPKYEEQLELKIAKAQLEELKKDASEAMETQRKSNFGCHSYNVFKILHILEEMLKGIFFEVKKKFETALGVLRKEKITIDPADPAAVEQYAKVMKTVREKADLFSESQRINYTIQTRTQGIPDARTYLLTLKEIRVKRGLTDDLGAETMMMEALEKVEKEIKKPLLRSDKKGMALLLAEFDKINQKLGIRKENLPKYEEQLELKIAKAQLEELKKDAFEAMETQRKREEFKDEEIDSEDWFSN